MTTESTSRKPNTVENILFGTTIDRVPSLIPGVLLAAAVVVAAVVAVVRVQQERPCWSVRQREQRSC